MRVRLLIVIHLLIGAALPSTGWASVRENQTVERLSARWVKAVAARDPALVHLLSRAGRTYYPKIRHLALHADAQQLRELEMVDQLQAMFLRLMLEPDELRSMEESELLIFALEQGLIGMDLRRSDELREIVVVGDEARGRLYKFGLDDRPDRGLQYFVREDGVWRVALRGELERLAADFQTFVDRTRLSAAEAAFFVLEMRLMRKVTPADFSPPGARQQSPRPETSAPAEKRRPRLRLVAVRTALDGSSPVAATLEDRVESLRYVLVPGDVLPSYPAYVLARAGSDSAVLRSDEGEITLRLNPTDALKSSRERPLGSAESRAEKSLLEHAEQGDGREGLMAQWRNVGLRDRPLLLQQGWLTPVHARTETGEAAIAGLRVQKLVDGSFWHQLGMQQGDLLRAVNKRPMDSMDAWKALIEVAQNDLVITITVQRGSKQLSFRTRTIRPR